jgi:hypothetical protein
MPAIRFNASALRLDRPAELLATDEPLMVMTDPNITTIREALHDGLEYHGHERFTRLAPRAKLYERGTDALDSLEQELARLRPLEKALGPEGSFVAIGRDRAREMERELADLRAEHERLRKALRPFGSGVEAFDRTDSTYGDGPVFERITREGRWAFTVSDARRAADALAAVEGERT